MERFLIHTFIKDHTNVEDQEVRYNYGRLSGIVGVIVNLLICIGELIVGLLIGSIAMISDAVHNVADAGGSLISLLSFKFSNIRPDEGHPYGHGRAEYLFSIVFSIILFVVAIQLLQESINRILHPTPVEFSIVAFIVMIVAMVLKVWLSAFLKSIGNKINSPILIANGTESLSDVAATGSIAIGLLVGYLFDVSVDGYLGVLVACLIGFAGFRVLKEATNCILGNEPSKERVDAIIKFITSYDGVLGTHGLMIHDYGPGKEFASIHVELNAAMDMIDAHTLVDRIERDIRNEMGIVLTTHMDPLNRDKETIRWFNKIHNIVKAYNQDFDIHDLRIIEQNDGKVISFDLMLTFKEWKHKEQIIQFFVTCIHTINSDYKVDIHAHHYYANGEE